MFSNIESSIVEVISTSALALIVLVLGVQKIIRDWKTTKAESDVISMLHTELQRMEEQNIKLSTEVHSLQQKIIQLSQEVTKLTIENNVLSEKLSKLMKQLSTEVDDGPSTNKS